MFRANPVPHRTETSVIRPKNTSHGDKTGRKKVDLQDSRTLLGGEPNVLTSVQGTGRMFWTR